MVIGGSFLGWQCIKQVIPFIYNSIIKVILPTFPIKLLFI